MGGAGDEGSVPGPGTSSVVRNGNPSWLWRSFGISGLVGFWMHHSALCFHICMTYVFPVELVGMIPGNVRSDASMVHNGLLPRVRSSYFSEGTLCV